MLHTRSMKRLKYLLRVWRSRRRMNKWHSKNGEIWAGPERSTSVDWKVVSITLCNFSLHDRFKDLLTLELLPFVQSPLDYNPPEQNMSAMLRGGKSELSAKSFPNSSKQSCFNFSTVGRMPE
jgi:hypothetical protein